MNKKEFDNTETIIIDDKENVKLVKANPDEFAVYAEIYINAEVSTYETINWKPIFNNRYLSNAQKDYPKDFTHWITKDDVRIAGIMINPFYAEKFFIISPYNDLKELVLYIKKVLHLLAGGENQSLISHVYGKQKDYLLEAGFKQKKLRLYRESLEDKNGWDDTFFYMMRPTEEFEINWDDNFKVVNPSKEHLEDVKKINISNFPEDHEDTLAREATEYFEYYDNCKISKKAALLVYDKKNNELAASIMAYIWQETAIVEALVVEKEYRGRGLGTNLMKHALNVFHEHGYHALKLCVFKDNLHAIKLYETLGFIKGLTITKMIV